MTTVQKLRIAVLLGGSSNERETSLDSGRNVIYKLSPEKYIVIPLFVTSSMELHTLTPALLVCNSTKEIETALTASTRVRWDDLSSLVDFVFIALHGGLGENGGVQGALEMLQIPYNGSSVLTSALCMDKYKTTTYLKSRGFDVPNSCLINQEAWLVSRQKTLEAITQSFTFPIIIKPHDDGCSVMVHKVTCIETLSQALDTVFAHGKKQAMVEEFIRGMELTVGVLGNTTPQALPPSQAIAQGDVLSIEEKFLPGAGENQTPAPLPSETLIRIQKTIVDVYTTMGCKGYARIDCFYQPEEQSATKKERVIIIEINTLPGLTPATCIFHQAAEIGMRPADFIDAIIQLGLEEHGHTSTTTAIPFLNNPSKEHAFV